MAADSHVTIEIPQLEDVDEIARVHVQGWRETYAELLPPRFYGADALAARTTMWRALLTNDPVPPRLRVARIDGSIVGVALAGASRDGTPARDLDLHLIYLLTGHHGSGAGQALLDAVIGSEPAQVWVAQHNPRAHSFYRRNGFQPDGVSVVDTDADGLVEVRLIR
ncbi:MAG TPA: GNAT family N-acetyltransferase [Glaciihabitans sp.]|nr:GNAT family N-acetyltransferase [Glaciihabitans sp.]